jgi:hypothetical protein
VISTPALLAFCGYDIHSILHFPSLTMFHLHSAKMEDDQIHSIDLGFRLWYEYKANCMLYPYINLYRIFITSQKSSTFSACCGTCEWLICLQCFIECTVLYTGYSAVAQPLHTADMPPPPHNMIRVYCGMTPGDFLDVYDAFITSGKWSSYIN